MYVDFPPYNKYISCIHQITPERCTNEKTSQVNKRNSENKNNRTVAEKEKIPIRIHQEIKNKEVFWASSWSQECMYRTPAAG